MKKIVSLIAAAMLLLSTMSPLATTVYALDGVSGASESATAETASADEEMVLQATEESAVQDQEILHVEELFAALPDAGSIAGMTAEELDAVKSSFEEALTAFNALTAEQQAYFTEEYAELYKSVVLDLDEALKECTTETDAPAYNSVQPMQQVDNVYLYLQGYSAEQYKSFSVDELLTFLRDENGNKIEIPQGVTSAWFYYPSSEREEYFTLNSGATIALWPQDFGLNGTTSEYLYIVLGYGSQLASEGCIKYDVQMRISTFTTSMANFLLAAGDGSGSDYNFFSSTQGRSNMFSEIEGAPKMPGNIDSIYIKTATSDEAECYVRIESMNLVQWKINGLNFDIYPMSNFLSYLDGEELTGAITEQVLSKEGYPVTSTDEIDESNYRTADNLWCFVVTDAQTGEIIGYEGVEIQIYNLGTELHGSFWVEKNGTLTEETESYLSTKYNINITVDKGRTPGENGCSSSNWESPGYYTMYTFLYRENVTEGLYFTIEKNSAIKSIYKGSYASEEEAVTSGAVDMTDQILQNKATADGQGYFIDYSNFSNGNNSYSQNFTIVFDKGICLQIQLYVSLMDGSSSTNSDRLDFEIQGASLLSDSGMTKYLYTYSATNDTSMPLDTYYRRDEKYDVGGYQLLLIKDKLTQEELKNLVPRFYQTDNTVVSSGGKMVSGLTTLQHAQWVDDVSDTVAFQAHIPGEKVKNYYVTFATQQTGPSLFVAGPDERFVNLTETNNYVHDILVANIGDEELTGIKVELINPVNVKLDSYWNLGGQGNDTLKPFDTTSDSYIDENGNSNYVSYATLPNIAKIRLLADGVGQISGTLRISAANGQSREIKLTGIASTPHIVSKTLDEAVKYVPYSFVVATNNMYSWNEATFKIVDGKLPEGLDLYEKTGEIYGVPQEAGEFKFTIQMDNSSTRFVSSTADFVLTVQQNTNEAVYMKSDDGYKIEVPLGEEQGEGTYDFYLENYDTDQLYVSEGNYGEFKGLWLNGERLDKGIDYTAVSGSTRITIRSQTFADKANKSGVNTIAAEFRVNNDNSQELKRTAQNFRLPENLGGSSNNPSGDNNSQGNQDNNTTGSEAGNTSASVGNTTQNNGGAGATGAAGTAAGNTAAQKSKNYVDLICYVVDASGTPMEGATVELHSTPRTAITGKDGSVRFKNVEFGSHTLTVKDSDGNIIASKTFELTSGSQLSVGGNQIVAKGGSLLSMRIKCEDGVLSIDDVSQIPQTGDTLNLGLIIGIMAISAAGLAGLFIYRKRMKQ